MKVKIYQINMEKDKNGVVFSDSEYAVEKNGMIKKDIYDLVYDGEIDVDGFFEKSRYKEFRGEIPYSMIPECIFTILNLETERPLGYKGASMSVSDVMELENGDIFYVDPFGFAKLSNF